TLIASDITLIDQPNSRLSGTSRAPGAPRNPAAPKSARNATRVTHQAGWMPRCLVRTKRSSQETELGSRSTLPVCVCNGETGVQGKHDLGLQWLPPALMLEDGNPTPVRGEFNDDGCHPHDASDATGALRWARS